MPLCLRLIIKTPSHLKRLNATQIKWQLKASYTLFYLQAYLGWKLAISRASPSGNAVWAGIFAEGVRVPPPPPRARPAAGGPPGAPRAEPAVTAGPRSRYLGAEEQGAPGRHTGLIRRVAAPRTGVTK